MNKYVCKKCGKFVSKDAETCKSCGTPDPAIPLSSKSSTSMVENKKQTKDNFYSYHKDNNKKDQIITEANKMRLFILLFVLFFIGLKFYSSWSTDKSSFPKSSYAVSNDETYSSKYVYKDKSAPYYWIISLNSEGVTYTYSTDSKGENVLKKGNVYGFKFQKLKNIYPNIVIRGAVSMETEIWLLENIDQHYNGRNVDGIFVPSTSTLYNNDGESPNVFEYLCELELQ